MVDLPTVPISTATSQAPKANLSGAEIASPYTDLARSMEKLGDASTTAAKSLATQAGYKAVTRDANGDIQVERAPIIGEASQYYAHAVKLGYLAEAEGDARRKDIELRTQFRDQPHEYLTAANAFTKTISEKAENAAGPDVALALRRSIEPITTQTFKGLLNEKERLDLHRAVNAIDAEIETTKNQMYAMARGGVTSGPDWQRASDKIKTLYNSLGANPRLAYPKEKINLELSQFDSELRVQGLTHHIVDEVYAKNGYEAAAKVAESIRTDPKLNLSPQQRDTAYSRTMAELHSKARDDMREVKGVAAQIDGVEKMALNGYPVPPEQMGSLRAQVSATKVPELAQALDRTEAVVATMKQWSTFSPAQLEMALGSLDKTMKEKGATPEGLALKDAGDKLLKNMRTQVAADPLGWSDRTNVMPVPPIQFGSKDAAGQMTDRASRAEIIAQHYGIAPTYLRPDEKAALEVAAAKGGDSMLLVARTLVDGFGDRAPKVMAEISKDAPALAHVGALMQSGGNAQFATDVADAVALRANPDAKRPHWVDKPDDKIIAAQDARMRDQYGEAFTLLPTQARSSERAAQDAFQTRAIRNGYDPALGQGRVLAGVQPKSDSERAFDKTLQEAAGAKFIGDVQYGGVGTYSSTGVYGFRTAHKAMVPASVRADRFPDVIGAITDDDLKKMPISPVAANGEAYTARDIRNALPVKVNGGYAFAQGDVNSDSPKYIRGADGKPFVLNFDQMEERLRARVPGAFIGGK